MYGLTVTKPKKADEKSMQYWGKKTRGECGKFGKPRRDVK
jgi:hypothetical protein